MAKILYECGLIDNITPAEIDVATLVNAGVGDTPKAIEKMFKDNSGKVIFIDEAYQLANHGTEAIDAIVKSLTDPRFEGNQALILAGYTENMESMIAENVGMRDRFANIWHFADYSNEELWVIVTHLATLRAQGDSLHEAIARTEAAIAVIERISDMNEKDAFESLKKQGLKDFEETFGEEARQRYGDDAIDAANERMMALNRDEWDAKELLEESIKVQLRLAMASGDPVGEESVEHARWIRIHWGEGYSREAHLGLAHGYLADQRFIDYYDDACGQGATEFLVRALEANL